VGSGWYIRRMPAWLDDFLAALRRWRARLPALWCGRVAEAVWTRGVYRPRHGLGRLLSRRSPALVYRLYAPRPAQTNGALPLLVLLHGCQQDAASFAAGTRMNRLAERKGFAVLYPEQNSSFNPLRCWNCYRPRDRRGEGEAALIAGMIDKICADYAFDRRRVYIAGMSAGAAMARVLAARHGALFAACGLHSGVYNSAAKAPADDVDFVPTIAIHGTADTVAGRADFDQLAAQLAQGLAARESVEQIDGRACTRREYSRDGRVYLLGYAIEGLRHAWSGGDSAYQFNDGAGPRASELIWEFVSRYRRDPDRLSSPREAPWREWARRARILVRLSR